MHDHSFRKLNEESRIPGLVYGLRAHLIRFYLTSYFLLTALRMLGNPWKGYLFFRNIHSFRQKFEGKRKTFRKFICHEDRYYFASDSLGFPSDNFRAFMRDECLRRMNHHSYVSRPHVPMQTLFWGITNRCLLHCDHCYEWDNIDTLDSLSLKELLEVLQIIKSEGIRHLQLSGGEPLVRFDDLTELIRMASTDMECWLLTSGYGLTASKAKALKDSGLLGVNISLDHWCAELHNDFRKHDKSFDWVMQAVQHCRESGLLVSLSLCVTREFVSEDNMMAYARLAKHLGVQFVRILEARAVGKFYGKEVHLKSSQASLISQFVIKMNTSKEFRNFPIMIFFGHHQRRVGCMGAGDRYLYIDAKGDVHACPFCRGSQGNVLDIPFEIILSNIRERGCHYFDTLEKINPQKNHLHPV